MGYCVLYFTLPCLKMLQKFYFLNKKSATNLLAALYMK